MDAPGAEASPSLFDPVSITVRRNTGEKWGVVLGDDLSLTGVREGSAADRSGVGRLLVPLPQGFDGGKLLTRLLGAVGAYRVTHLGSVEVRTRAALEAGLGGAGESINFRLEPQVRVCCPFERWAVGVPLSPGFTTARLRGEVERMYSVPDAFQEMHHADGPVSEGCLEAAGLAPGGLLSLRLRKTGADVLDEQLSRVARDGFALSKPVSEPPWNDDMGKIVREEGSPGPQPETDPYLIAQGAYGQVWRCRRRDGEAVAVKEVT
eukprot:Hpha_TRINITY_DN36080_c0_g1::TRINITY_DN36080_c0_g1_i1::g.170883::m.170883